MTRVTPNKIKKDTVGYSEGSGSLTNRNEILKEPKVILLLRLERRPSELLTFPTFTSRPTV
jgi:hypothetical protein